MAQSSPLRIGGVPEHFNEPFHIAQQFDLWEKHHLKIEWHEIKEGSGAMIKAIKADQVDVIIGLTECIVADIANGSDLRIIGTYVASPLVWAISSGAQSSYNSVQDLKDTKIAVSRLNSGSHLMAAVLASQIGWNESSLKYEEKGTFEDMRTSLNQNECSALLWETFMTKPFHDRGEIKRIGELVSPWPSFVIAATTSTIQTRLEELFTLVNVVQQAIGIFYSDPHIISSIANKYTLQPHDAEEWFKNVRIVAELSVEEKVIITILDALKNAKILTNLEKIPKPSAFVDDRICRLV